MFKIEIDGDDNAAFDPKYVWTAEIKRIVRNALDKLTFTANDNTINELILRDIDGNRVGTMRWTTPDNNPTRQ